MAQLGKPTSFANSLKIYLFLRVHSDVYIYKMSAYIITYTSYKRKCLSEERDLIEHI